jgi:hypothetical protein
MCVKFSEPGRVIGDNPLFGHSQPIRRGTTGRSAPAQPRGVGTRYELRASDVLAMGQELSVIRARDFGDAPHPLSAIHPRKSRQDALRRVAGPRWPRAMSGMCTKIPAAVVAHRISA